MIDAGLLEHSNALFEDLHRHPELSWQEYETATRIHRFLTDRDVPVKEATVEPALFVDIVGERPGKRVFFRADIDALPIAEQTKLPYRSERDGAMHACGHDFHSATAAAAAVHLWRDRANLAGTVRIAFQPAEEAAESGARALVREGYADDFDAFFALHVDPKSAGGELSFRDGPMNAAVDAFTIHVFGTGGHSSRPHHAIDPVQSGALIVNQFTHLNGRAAAAQEPAVLAVTVFQAGDAFNVIPEHATLRGTLRTSTPDSRLKWLAAMKSVVDGVGRTFGTRTEIEWDVGHPAVINDRKLARRAKNAIRETFGRNAFRSMPFHSMGGDDFANYGDKGPVLLARVGTQRPDGSNNADLHAPNFEVDPAVLRRATEALVVVSSDLARDADA